MARASHGTEHAAARSRLTAAQASRLECRGGVVLIPKKVKSDDI